MVKKLVIAAIGVLVSIGLVVGVRYFVSVKNYQNKVRDTEIREVALSKVKDGNYIGSYDADFVQAKVKVEIKCHRITSIKLLEHKTERGKRAEVIPYMVVKAQSLKVDTITGATNSSKVILKSIEKALEKGENE
ncbi:uncharacterized protein with FMN-binding domain [Clostridium acetobutylicum]|uniref:Uncharacterized conserved protein n=1 Tax=Clostridium acetobutylicum (strain ATCC 824 / DSM 792 / JCM 1419 / IAM 19013 / LMG 5710 / NBRC 13948 / NRRL B-527 / VKM B-1787 / 2291 / W) TaxID=272562 RepID=Q97FH2_CLOAB|nr:MULTISPECIES: FMN-binding protein [Clostridium]AAK80711.1 Uncharacterized conserved protein [Clostridium acetobutylicum ATCC 824]ADZ21812.1 Conserved hypothetical protein [Clostridium acetobutylicum EA 2018]AEI32536.1 hypothetical protein SMB_G2802 [Clostridium acetobutylicum DSM 1731]AWV78875.1 FMN-binding protein [Clostridium acetobutylicum]MBC2395112.1 FMN-binding protein [Clostridium acetobutylicum]